MVDDDPNVRAFDDLALLRQLQFVFDAVQTQPAHAEPPYPSGVVRYLFRDCQTKSKRKKSPSRVKGCGAQETMIAIAESTNVSGMSPDVQWLCTGVAALILILIPLWIIANKRIPEKEAVEPIQPQVDDPGNYIIAGVDRTTGRDVTWPTHAASRENAKVKAELQGIVVTKVTYEPPKPAALLAPAPPKPAPEPKPPKIWDDARIIRTSIACMLALIVLATVVILVLRK